MLRNLIRFAQKTLRVLSERQPIGKSESRDHLCSGDDAFSQLYFVYCKKKRQNQGANYPGCADGDLLVVHLRSGVRNALTNAKHGAPEWVLRVLARLKGFEPLRSSPLRGLLRNLIRFAQKTLRVLSERQPIGKSESRDHLCSGDDAFSQLYFMYCKKKRRNQGANYPGCADGDLLVVHLRSGVRTPSFPV